MSEVFISNKPLCNSLYPAVLVVRRQLKNQKKIFKALSGSKTSIFLICTVHKLMKEGEGEKESEIIKHLFLQ